MSKEETPISKYLASLERRQALLTPSPTPDATALIRKINFEDTYFQGDRDKSILEVSQSPEHRQPTKRRRLSILGEELEEQANQSKKIIELERLLQQTQGELIESRALNSKLEHQISRIKCAHGEKILEFEKSENEIKRKFRDANDQVVQLKEKVTKLSKKEGELLARLHMQTETHLEQIRVVEERLRTYETENLDLRSKIEGGTLKQSDELKRLNKSLEETVTGAEKWVMEAQLLRDQMEVKDKQLEKYQKEVRDAQSIICKYNELKAKYDYPKGADDTPEAMEEKRRYFENMYTKQQAEVYQLMEKMDQLVDENKMLRSTMTREALMEQQISEFQDELRQMRGMLSDKVKLEEAKINLEADVKAWRAMAFKLDPDCTHPHKLQHYIRKIQNQLLEAKHDSSTLTHAMADRERVIARMREEIGALQAQVKTLSADKDNFFQELKKTTRRLILITKDRDGLKDLKESYEQEFEGVISKPLQERINQLEATVSEYEAIIQEDPSAKQSCGDCEKRMALITEIRTELERLKTEKGEMEVQLADMSRTMGASVDEGNTTGLKIVSFGVNPSTLSLEARLKESIKENEELKEKIKELQERTTAGDSTLETGESIRDLEERNRNLDRRLVILTEAYDFETQQLQLIVNKLCGFHFTLVREPSVQIRLSSVYSHERDDTFIFQESPNGDMLLLESPILDSFRDDIDRFLIRDGSIPGFLSSVTITYLQNQASSQDASQVPASQQSVVEDETESGNLVVHNPREIQVEVTRQRHPTGTEQDFPDDDEEEVDEDEDAENDEQVEEEAEEEEDEHDDDGGEMEELEDDEHFDEDDDEQYEDEEEPEPSPPSRRLPPQISRVLPSRPPPEDDSDDSDVIMIDD